MHLSNAISAPVLSEKITKESGFAGFDVNADPEEVIKCLRITIEAQRHDEHPGLDRHYIGGRQLRRGLRCYSPAQAAIVLISASAVAWSP